MRVCAREDEGRKKKKNEKEKKEKKREEKRPSGKIEKETKLCWVSS